jgi:hypothetical protein
MDPRDVIEQTLPVPRQRSEPMRVRATRYLQKRWTETSLQLKLDGATLTTFVGLAAVLSLSFSTFFVFGLTLIGRLLFYAIYSWRVELRRFEAKVATRTLAFVNVCAFVSVTVALAQSEAIWKVGSYWFLVITLMIEVFSVRTWWTWWATHNHATSDPVWKPKFGHLLAAFALLISQYVAFGILWIPLLDKIILATYHVMIWMITHPIESIIIIVVAVAIVVVTKVYVVIIWVITNPAIILGIMAIIGIIGIVTR